MAEAINRETLERILKCVVMYNGKKIEFDKKFLEIYDHVELRVTDNGDSLTIEGRMKK